MKKETKKILIVGGKEVQIKKMIALINRASMKYDTATTEEEATEKMFVSKNKYDAVILSPTFPTSRLLENMAKRNCHVPTLIHGFVFGEPNYDFVVGMIRSWNLIKIKDFLEYIREKTLLVGIDDAESKEIISVLEQESMQYDIALTLEEAADKLFSAKQQYNSIILSPAFPENEEKRANGKEGERLLEMMDEKCHHVPTLMYGYMFEKPNYDFVFGVTRTWDLLKVEDFLKEVKRRNRKIRFF